jgi:hypothetical protein
MSDEELKSELERLRNENAALKKGASTGIRMKVSEKGAVSIYGMGRFPVTLYKEQWLKLLHMSEDIRAFIAANEGKLKKKDWTDPERFPWVWRFNPRRVGQKLTSPDSTRRWKGGSQSVVEMSRAFVRERDLEALEELPDRLISPYPNDVTDEGMKQLESMLEASREAHAAALRG